jgi:heme/copper-type cytochrome/quinol oxidase subunit 2
MIARLLVSFGSVAAAVGFTLFGMATTYIKTEDWIAKWSYVLMAVGIVAAVIGVFWYRAEERAVEASAKSRPR